MAITFSKIRLDIFLLNSSLFLSFRVFAFYEQQKKFFLLAQSQYLTRCVLTVNHVIDCLNGERPLVMMFAGDTAGRISCWDITTLLLSHIRECCTPINEQVEKFRNVTESEARIEYDVENLEVDGGKVINKSSEKNTFKASFSSGNGDTSHTTSESVTSFFSEKGVTTDSLKAAENAEQNGNFSSGKCSEVAFREENLTDFEADVNASTEMANSGQVEQRTGKTDSKNLANIQTSTKDEVSETDTKENAVVNVAFVVPQNQHRSTQLQDNPTLDSEFKEQSDFSCLPLVQTFLPPPIHVFKCHQSGVNALSLVNINGKLMLL